MKKAKKQKSKSISETPESVLSISIPLITDLQGKELFKHFLPSYIELNQKNPCLANAVLSCMEVARYLDASNTDYVIQGDPAIALYLLQIGKEDIMGRKMRPLELLVENTTEGCNALKLAGFDPKKTSRPHSFEKKADGMTCAAIVNRGAKEDNRISRIYEDSYRLDLWSIMINVQNPRKITDLLRNRLEKGMSEADELYLRVLLDSYPLLKTHNH